MNLFKDILIFAAFMLAELLFFAICVAIISFAFGVGR